MDDSSIDYTLPLAGQFPVSSAVVLCFRTQIFVTRSDVVLGALVFTVANRKSLVGSVTVSATLWRRKWRDLWC